MKRLFISVVLLAPIAIGCSNSDKSKASASAPPAGGKPAAATASLASAGGEVQTPTTPAARRADPVYSYVDEARQDLSDGKVNVINQVMRLSRDESAKFWPIYHDYEDELFDLGDKRIEMTRAFLKAQSTGSLDNDNATALTKDWFDTESQRLTILKKYHDQIASGISPVRAAQFAQLEHRFDTVIDLMIASELPLVRGGAAAAAAEPAAAAPSAAVQGK
jgi:hypothetical protein